MKYNMNEKKFKKTIAAVEAYSSLKNDKTDFLGSYSGVPKDYTDPIQDVDDL
ncbi:MAG: hypothetical protein RR458_06390 [Clostridia bacterium]